MKSSYNILQYLHTVMLVPCAETFLCIGIALALITIASSMIRLPNTAYTPTQQIQQKTIIVLLPPLISYVRLGVSTCKIYRNMHNRHNIR